MASLAKGFTKTRDDLPEPPMTPRQVAEAYGISYQNVIIEINTGRLPARRKKGTKRWFITKDNLREWLETGMWD